HPGVVFSRRRRAHAHRAGLRTSSGTRLPGRPLIGRRPSERHPGSSACVSPSQFGVASPILPRLCEPEDPECDGRSTEDPGTPSGHGDVGETHDPRQEEGQHPEPGDCGFTGERTRLGDGDDRGQDDAEAEQQYQSAAESEHVVPEPTQNQGQSYRDRPPVVPTSSAHRVSPPSDKTAPSLGLAAFEVTCTHSCCSERPAAVDTWVSTAVSSKVLYAVSRSAGWGRPG